MLSSIMIISIYDDSDWQGVLMRSVTIWVLSLIIFCLNIHVIALFKYSKKDHKCYKRESKYFRNAEKKIFACGLLGTMILFGIYYLISMFLFERGVDMHLPDNLINAGGWRIVLILFYVSVVEYTIIYLIQYFALSQYEKSQFEFELLKLKNSNAETANQLLQQQIKPHFLFNALSTLKSLIKKKPDIAETYLIQLSDFLRASFAHTDTKSGLTRVAEELKICSNYMSMQKVRFGEALHYKVNEKVKSLGEDCKIPTFALQPLLENAIKHNVVTNRSPLFIELTVDDGYFQVSNNIQPKPTVKKSTEKGLNNLRERYRILSKDEIKVEKTASCFTVSLKIL